MAVKLIITDLDGTLLGEDHQTISPRTLKALKNVSEKGIKIAIGSGRTYGVLQNVLKQTEHIDYIMMANGAAIMDNRTKEQIKIGELPFELWLKLYKLLKKHEAVFEVYFEGQSYIERESTSRFVNDWIPEAFLKELTECMTEVDCLLDVLRGESLEKIDVIQTPEKSVEALIAELSQIPDILVTSSLPGNMEINLKGADKGNGTIALCRMLGITTDEVMAFGDANNDLEMMKTAGYSYAMGNASDDVKAAARYQTVSNGEDGVAIVLENIELEEL